MLHVPLKEGESLGWLEKPPSAPAHLLQLHPSCWEREKVMDDDGGDLLRLLLAPGRGSSTSAAGLSSSWRHWRPREPVIPPTPTPAPQPWGFHRGMVTAGPGSPLGVFFCFVLGRLSPCRSDWPYALALMVPRSQLHPAPLAGVLPVLLHPF